MDNFQSYATRVLCNLKRQHETIDYEKNAWTTDDLNGHKDQHKDQIEEISNWLAKNNFKLRLKSADLALQNGNEKVFWDNIQDIKIRITIAREALEIYRDRFHIYYSPLNDYLEIIEAAECVALNCYGSVITTAFNLLIIRDNYRLMQPLLQLSTLDRLPLSSSPITFNRENYPVPIIVIPIDQMANSWNFLAINHELGHDVFPDLGFMKNDQADWGNKSVVADLLKSGVNQQAGQFWGFWVPELMADFFALYTAGPAYIGFLIDTFNINLNDEKIPGDPYKYPPDYLRIKILISLARTMPGSNDFEDIVKSYEECLARRSLSVKWHELFRENLLQPLDDYLNQTNLFIKTVVEAPVFKTQSSPGNASVCLKDLIMYNQKEHQKVVDLKNSLLQGVSLNGIEPRLVASAGQLAFEQVVNDGKVPDGEEEQKAFFADFNDLILKTITKKSKTEPANSWDDILKSLNTPADTNATDMNAIFEYSKEMPNMEQRMQKLVERIDNNIFAAINKSGKPMEV